VRLRHIAGIVAFVAIVGTFIQQASKDGGRQIDFVPPPTEVSVTATTTINMTRPTP